MSSIDDEFALLFLPDLELLNSLNNGPPASVDAAGSDKRSEATSFNHYTMDEINTDESFHPASLDVVYPDRNPLKGGHWLHHYSKLTNSYNPLLRQLPPSFVGYPSAEPPVPIQPALPSVSTQIPAEIPLGATEFMNSQMSQQSVDINSIPPQDTTRLVLESLVGNSPAPDLPMNVNIAAAALRKSKQSSSDYAHLLLLSSHKVEDVSLLDDRLRKVEIHAYGDIDGRFLYTKPGSTEAEVSRISCYRRNYIQIAFDIVFDQWPQFVSTPQQDKIPITGLTLSVYATTNFSLDKIELLVFDKDRKKVQTSPDVVFLDNSTFHYPRTQFTGKPNRKFVLKKTQFRNATPNNGKSTVFQNYYYIIVSVAATTQGFGDIPLMSLKSVPIKVRGRNPSFYNDRNDILIIKPLNHTAHPSTSLIGSEEPPVLEAQEESPMLQITKIMKPQPLSQNNTPNVDETIVDSTPEEALETPVSPRPQSKTPSNYEYFPLSNVYYLPPIDAHYFPHGVHHPRQSSIVKHRKQSQGLENRSSPTDESLKKSEAINNPEKLGSSNRFIKMRLMNILNNDSGTNRSNPGAYH